MEFRVLPIKNRELFLKYAIPCGEVLVRRGELRDDLLKRMNDDVSHGQASRDIKIENIFRVASRMCTILARKMNKTEIDDEVIRSYFMKEHEKAIKWRQEVHPDLKLKDCLVYPGRVIEAGDSEALIKTPLGEALFRNDFDRKLEPGDRVSTHYDHVSEKISAHHERIMSDMLKKVL